MSSTKDVLNSSSKLYKLSGKLKLPQRFVEEYESCYESLNNSCATERKLYWYFLQSCEEITDLHLKKYKIIFEEEITEKNLANIAYNHDNDFLEYIKNAITSFTNLDCLIHNLSDQKIELGMLPELLIGDYESIGKEFYSINKDEKTTNFHIKIISYLKSIVNQLLKSQKNILEENNNCDDINFDSNHFESPFDNIMLELYQLIGMNQLKEDIQQLINLIKVQQIRLKKGMKVIPISKHLVFTGNPGTGKTTVARILGKIYNSLGILSMGQLIEVDRAGLVAGYVGQTAIKTDEVIQKAMGGILFIDEAYTLSTDEYGREAIDTILKRMEDYRENLVVIVAGYPENMIDFIQSNPGLESRFNKYICFEDYTPEELTNIFKIMCNEQQYTFDESVLRKVLQYSTEKYMNRNERFSNGRLIRNLFESTISNQANRLVKSSDMSKKALSQITVEDIVY